jgi:hypothetical protein
MAKSSGLVIEADAVEAGQAPPYSELEENHDHGNGRTGCALGSGLRGIISSRLAVR